MTTLLQLLLLIALVMIPIWLHHKRDRFSCPNGHTKQLQEVGREVNTTRVLEKASGAGHGVGFAQSYIHPSVTYQCNECGESWTRTESMR